MKLSSKMGGKAMKPELFIDKHRSNLPTIRIASVTLENFKSVKHGEVILNCGRKFIPYGTQADILGLYGQNGSGKTALIEAISILKYLLSGQRIPDSYADCIDITADYAMLTFVFDFQYPHRDEYPTNNDIRKVVYSFKLARAEKSEDEQDEIQQVFADSRFNRFLPTDLYRIKIFDEVLKSSGTVCGKKTILKPFLDTSVPGSYIEPKTRAKYLAGSLDAQKRVTLGVNKSLAEVQSRSFVFMSEMISFFRANSNYSPYYQMLAELRVWGKYYLIVVDSKSTSSSSLNIGLPVFLGEEPFVIPVTKSFPAPEEVYEELQKYFNSISLVLTQIVPGLNVGIKDYGQTLLSDGEEGRLIGLIANRHGVELPLRAESDGVIKLIATLYCLVSAYSQQSTTVAYDEFDASIFEYLLGEILQVMQDSGKGQFIFTSHNMRPLEVLSKDYIWFTTTDPNNRYTRLAGLGESNNLRRVYYREIAMQDHYDNLYSETKRNMIISAMRKAGGIFNAEA